MNILLKLKHWQLFTISWGAGILLNIFAIADPYLILRLFPLAMLLFTFGTFGWIWAIATGLHRQLPEGIKLNITRFKILFAVPIVYILMLCTGMSFVFFGGNQDMLSEMVGLIGVIVLLHLLSIGCIFYGMRFAAKTLRSIELGRQARFGDYVGEIFLIWFSIIGYWILQPRINKLAGHGGMHAGAL